MHLRNIESALNIVNSQVVDEMRRYGGGPVDVSVELVLNVGGDEKITFKRVDTFNVSQDDVIHLTDKLSISSQGQDGYKIYEDKDETFQLVHQYLPEEINSYIFFDGEQLEKFFSKGQLENIKTGINELTQASYLKAVYEYLERYIRDVISSRITRGGDKEIIEQQKKVEELESQISLSENTIKEIDGQIHSCWDNIENLNNKIHGCENVREKTEELKNSEEALNELNDSLAIKNQELMKFAREYYTLFSVYPSVKRFHDYIERQKDGGKLPPKIDAKILDKIIEKKECLICGRKHLTDEDLKAVRKLRMNISVASETSNELSNALGAMDSFFGKINIYVDSHAKLVNEIKTIEKNKTKEETHNHNLNVYLRSIPDNEEIAKALNERDSYRNLNIKLSNDKAKEEFKLKQNEQDKADEDKKLRTLMAKENELAEIIRKKDFCESCIDILKSSKKEILDECRIAIQNETFRIFDSLVWKENAFSKVEILDDFSFRLLDRFGNQTLGSCSAAETALLALSFTLALQNVSKHDSLLFIDTPIGRVGKQNRTNFMNTLLKIAKEKQVILTFTPTEYDTNVQEILSNHYNSFHMLSMDEEGTTTIKDKLYEVNN